MMQPFALRSLFYVCGFISVLLIIAGVNGAVQAEEAAALPEGFVYLDTMAPEIIQDLRYFGPHNFLGRPAKGYTSGRCILTREAATALSQAQHRVQRLGYTLKVYDCYRPQTAVNDFTRWATDLGDEKMKPYFYPHVDKTVLFKQGYLAAKSGHSRGSTVDLTLVPIAEENQATVQPDLNGPCTAFKHFRFRDNSIDMGTAFDCFDPKSHTDSPMVSRWARKNRLLLKTEMAAQGFRNLPEEWWHYTLNAEPFPDTYFDFPLQ